MRSPFLFAVHAMTAGSSAARILVAAILIGLVVLAPAPLEAQRRPSDQTPVWVDSLGVLRWSSTGREVAAFGVNYAVPFAHAYRAIDYVGADHETTIDRDVYHLARMGVDAYRIHVWDIEISDMRGNLLDNDHLRLFDYLIMRLEERGIRIVLTILRNDDNAYPERPQDVLGWGFSRKYGKRVSHYSPEAVAPQEVFVKQFVSHVNRYTGRSYKDDPDILAFEINNEPPHGDSVQKVRNYVNTMVAALRSTGLKKPIFYNMSHNFGVTDAFLTADIQGGTFQWYPTGLNAGFTQKGNFLPNVDRYPIPFANRPGFADKALLIYEFSTADVADSYLYPAMARSFRERGFQFMTQFAYDAMPLAAINSEYKTHHLNLAHTPSKAISFKIASEVAHRIPRHQSFGRFPADTAFGPFRVSYLENLAEMATDSAFYYSNDTQTRPPAPAALEHVAGVGSSPVVRYEGTGAYFLDRLAPGVWRLEVMPDAVLIADPFADPNLNRKVTRIVWHDWPMRISLPDLGEGYRFRGVNEGNVWEGAADGSTIMARPGAYVLTRRGASSDGWTASSRLGRIAVGEFVAPPATGAGWTVLHQPAREAPAAGPLRIRARVVGPGMPDTVQLFYTTSEVGEPRPGATMYGYRPHRLPMRRVSGYTWEAVVPDSATHAGGGILYWVVVENDGKPQTWPGAFSGRPGDWDYTNKAYWSTRFAERGAPPRLLHPERDYGRILPLRTRYSTAVEKRLVVGSTVGSHAIRVSGRLSRGELVFLREYVGDDLRPRRAELRGFTHLVIRARSRSPDTRTLQLGLLTTDGYTYAAPVELGSAWTEIRIPLDSLEQTGTALRLTYPQMMDDFFVPSTPIPFDPGRIEKWEISTANSFDSGTLDFEVENLWLER